MWACREADTPPDSSPAPKATSRKSATVPTPTTDAEQQAHTRQRLQEEQLRLEEIYFQMSLDRRRYQERLAMLAAEVDTNTMSLWHGVMTRRQKVMEQAGEAWLKVLIS